MMPKHLPLLVNRSISEAHAARLLEACQFEAKVLSTGQVSCHPGCANCCHYPLTVSILEGISIYQWLADHHLWTPKLKEKLQTHKGITWNLAPEVWLLSVIPCPFLNEVNRCSIYDSRPFLCQTLFSKGDPYYCHPHRLGVNQAGIINRSDAAEALWKAEKTTLKRHALRAISIPLSTALLLGERIIKGEIEIEETNTTLMEEHTQNL